MLESKQLGPTALSLRLEGQCLELQGIQVFDGTGKLSYIDTQSLGVSFVGIVAWTKSCARLDHELFHNQGRPPRALTGVAPWPLCACSDD